MTSKTCSYCYETKPLSEFNRNSSMDDGRQIYCRACHQANNENDKRMYVNGQYVSRKSPLYKPGHYKTLDDAFSHNELERVKEGYVYAMINPAFPGWVKVGCAVSMTDRENSYQTADPFRKYKMIGGVSTNDRKFLEKLAHDHCERSAEERRGEWFRMNEVHALNIIRKEAREQCSSFTYTSQQETSGTQ